MMDSISKIALSFVATVALAACDTVDADIIVVDDELASGDSYTIDLRRADTLYFVHPDLDTSRVLVTGADGSEWLLGDYLDVCQWFIDGPYEPGSDGLWLGHEALDEAGAPADLPDMGVPSVDLLGCRAIAGRSDELGVVDHGPSEDPTGVAGDPSAEHAQDLAFDRSSPGVATYVGYSGSHILWNGGFGVSLADQLFSLHSYAIGDWNNQASADFGGPYDWWTAAGYDKSITCHANWEAWNNGVLLYGSYYCNATAKMNYIELEP